MLQYIKQTLRRLELKFSNASKIRKVEELNPDEISVVYHELQINKPSVIHHLDYNPNLNGQIDELFSRYREVRLFRQYLAVFDNVTFTGRDGLMIFENGSFCLDHVHFFDDYIRHSKDYYRRWLKRKKVSFNSTEAYSLLGYKPGEFYHMMSDILPRLYFIKDILPSSIKYIVPKKSPEAFLEAISAIGIEKSQLIFIHEYEDVQVSKLYWSPPLTYSGFSEPLTSIKLSKNLLKSVYKDQKISLKKRTYITRRDSSKRRVSNEKDLINLLLRYDFQVVELSNMTFQDQVKVFNNSLLIIAPHGAGLVNLLYCQQGTRVLELFPVKMPRGGTCYWSLSSAMKLKYNYVNCQSDGNSDDEDFAVPLDNLASWINNDIKNSDHA